MESEATNLSGLEVTTLPFFLVLCHVGHDKIGLIPPKDHQVSISAKKRQHLTHSM